MSVRWSMTKLSNVAYIASGQGAPQSTSDFNDTGIPFVRAGSLDSLIQGGSENDCERITEKAAIRHGLKLFHPGTILFAKSGMSAKLNRIYQLKSDAYVVNHLAAIVPSDDCDSSFLKYWFQVNPPSRLVKDESYPSIRLSDIEEIEIPLPPLEEQRRIAAILNKADAIRRKRQESIYLTEEFLRSTFLEMFGDPVTNPKGWKIKKFSAVGSLDRGVSKNRPRNAPELLGGPYPLIQTGDVSNSEGYIRSYKSTYSEIGLRQSKMWPAGTLCITIAANIAKTGILTFDACFPDSVVGFTPNELAKTEYVQYWLGFLQKNLEDNAPESAQKNINLDILRKLDIPLPEVELQRRFAGIVRATQSIKAKLADAAIQDIQLFKSLTQHAFRGELS